MLSFMPLFTVPGFGPCQYGGPPGHMGAVQPGKPQVEYGAYNICNLICIVPSWVFYLFLFFFSFITRLVHPRYPVLRCLIPARPMAPAQLQLLPFCSRIRHHHCKNATILLLEKWALVIGPLLMIPHKLATDCPITTQLLLQALHHHRLHQKMGKNKMTPALSEF